MSAFRLAIVRQKYRPDGGAERFITGMLEALQQQNLDLSLITREWQGEINPHWHIHRCSPLKWSRISREKGFAQAAHTLWQREQFDLVQSHERISGCDIYRAGDGVHRRWLLQRARLLPQWRRKWLFSNGYHRYVMCAEHAMYNAPELKAVICNSAMIKREIMADFGLAAEKIAVIYNAIDHHYFIPPDERLRYQLRQQFSIPQQATCLIFVGSGFERKGLAAALHALAPTRRYLMVVGKDKAWQKYRALARSLGCSERVIFTGIQKHILPLYQAADGLLLPTLYDPFPNAILEAMACGLPVITSTNCGGAEFIQQGKNGFVCDALDIKALTEAIHALPHYVLTSTMSQAARASILGVTHTQLSQQLMALYGRLLNQPCAF